MPDDDAWLSNFSFEVLITPSGLEGDEQLAATAAFASVAGLELTLEVKELREGGYNAGMRRLVEKASSPPLVLKRGMSGDEAFWTWIQACTAGRFPLPYVDGEIHVRAPAGEGADTAAAVWRFRHGIATRVKAADLDAKGGTSVPIEELHIVHEGLTRVPGGGR